ncbi:MAG: hypothetical protein AAGJ50_11935, partial [Pseudomonadota bacterium]
IAVDLSLGALLAPARLERLAAYEHRDSSALGPSDLLIQIDDYIFERQELDRHQYLARIVQSRYVEMLIKLAGNADLSFEVSSAVNAKLRDIETRLTGRRAARTDKEMQHFALLAMRIRQSLDGETPILSEALEVPPGSPIGAASGQELCWHCDP